jgi:hypothetical protein
VPTKKKGRFKMENTFMNIIKVLDSKDSTRGIRLQLTENDGTIQLSSFLDEIIYIWARLDKEQKNKIANIILKGQIKNYVGDIKWVLYQYICDLQEIFKTDDIYLTCGKYAYDKLSKMGGFTPNLTNKYNTLNLNGETIGIRECYAIDKKQVDISVDDETNILSLYFA